MTTIEPQAAPMLNVTSDSAFLPPVEMRATAKTQAALMPKFTFESNCLRSKFGFGDGDMLSDFLTEHGIPTRVGNAVLVACVKRYLLPKLPPVEVFEIGGPHNPIRLENPDERFKDIEVSVYGEDILRIAYEILRTALDERDTLLAAIREWVEADRRMREALNARNSIDEMTEALADKIKRDDRLRELAGEPK